MVQNQLLSRPSSMQALTAQEHELRGMPHLRDWLHLADPVKDIIMNHYGDPTGEIRQRVTEEENVLLQLQNIQTYPFVKKALDDGSLRLHGWYYNIGTGSIYSYNSEEDVFQIISEESMKKL